MIENPGKIFISVCMMVKNEEMNLARCLESIKDLVDEIIIVDTGSDDRTVEIAESFGARIYHHPWENDFSKHRNQSLNYARGEWVFILDADEEIVVLAKDKAGNLDKDVFRRFLTLIKDTEHENVGLCVNDVQKGKVVMKFNSSRIFRNGKVHYEGIVHNTPVTKTSNSVLCEWAIIRHYGYDLDPAMKDQKFQRTNTLLRERLEKNPDDYQAMFYLCQLNAESGRDNAEAMIWGERYIANRAAVAKTGPNNFNDSIYFTLFRLYLHTEQLENAKMVIQSALKDFGGDLDIAMAITEYGVATDDPVVKFEGINGFLKIWNDYESNATLKGNRFIYTHRPEGLAYILFQKALTHFVEGAKGANEMIEVLNTLNPEMRSGFISDFQRQLNDAGVPLQISFAKNEAPGDLVTANISEEVFQ